MPQSKYAKLKERHPHANVRNIKRLIAVIKESDHWKVGREKARIKQPKANGGDLMWSMAYKASGNVRALGEGNVPLLFDMTNWMQAMTTENMDITPEDVDMWNGSVMDVESLHSCGTAACIAGFAGALMARSRHTGMLEQALRFGHALHWEAVISEFLGIGGTAVRQLVSVGECPDHNCDVMPRHAVRLLETFLETGRVDWAKAMGWKRYEFEWILTKKEQAARIRDLARINRLMDKAKSMMGDDAQSPS